jgi:hypothetical protein
MTWFKSLGERKAQPSVRPGFYFTHLFQEAFDLLFVYLAEWNTQLGANPTLNGWRVWEFAAFDQARDTLVSVGSFFTLQVPVLGSRDGSIIADPVVADSG